MVTIKDILLLLIGAILAFAATRLHKSRDRKTDRVLQEEADAIEEVKRYKEKVSQLETKMAVLEAEAKPINAAYLQMLVAKATHFHTPEMDKLIGKLGPPSNLTPEERVELFDVMVPERMIDMGPEIDEAERLGVEMLRNVSKLADLEHRQLSANEMETVLISQPATETKPSPNGGTQQEEKGN